VSAWHAFDTWRHNIEIQKYQRSKQSTTCTCHTTMLTRASSSPPMSLAWQLEAARPAQGVQLPCCVHNPRSSSGAPLLPLPAPLPAASVRGGVCAGHAHSSPSPHALRAGAPARACTTTVSSQPRSGNGDVSATSLRSASAICAPSAPAAQAAQAPCARSATRLRGAPPLELGRLGRVE